MPGDLLAPGRDVAELEQIHDAPVMALQFGVAVAGLAGGADHLLSHRQALLKAVGPPERHVSRAQGGRERARVARGARGGDGLCAVVV